VDLFEALRLFGARARDGRIDLDDSHDRADDFLEQPSVSINQFHAFFALDPLIGDQSVNVPCRARGALREATSLRRHGEKAVAGAGGPAASTVAFSASGFRLPVDLADNAANGDDLRDGSLIRAIAVQDRTPSGAAVKG
jgi:hypothetical protein